MKKFINSIFLILVLASIASAQDQLMLTGSSAASGANYRVTKPYNPSTGVTTMAVTSSQQKLPYKVFVGAGTSITAGSYTGGTFWGNYLVSGSYGNVFAGMTVVNTGSSGNYLAHLIATFSTDIAPHLALATGSSTIAEIEIGANDYCNLAPANYPGTPAYSGSLATLIGLFHAQNTPVIIRTVLPRGPFQAANYELNRNTLNNAIREGGPNSSLPWDYLDDADAVYDSIYAFNYIYDPLLTADYPNGTHPSYLADQIAALNENNQFAGLPPIRVSGTAQLGSMAQQQASAINVGSITASSFINAAGPIVGTSLSGSSINVPGVVSPGTLQANLTNAYVFGGTGAALTADTVGTNTLTTTGTVTYTASGKIAGGASFPGAASYMLPGSYLQGSQFIAVSGSSWSVAGWFKPSFSGTGMHVFGEAGNRQTTFQNWSVNISDQGFAVLQLYNIASVGGNPSYNVGALAITTNNWYHVAVSYSVVTGTISVYFNGTLSGSQYVGTWVQQNTGTLWPLTLGQTGGDAGFDDYTSMSGTESAVLAFKGYALTPSDVTSLYNAGAGEQPPFPNNGSNINVAAVTANALYSGAVISGTLVSGTAQISSPFLATWQHPWVQNTNTSITNLGALECSVSGTTATIKSSNTSDTSTFDLHIVPNL